MSSPTLSAGARLHLIALGNPVAPQSTPHTNINPKVWPQGCVVDSGYRGSTLFLVDADSTVYDSGFRVLVTYYINPTVSACEENELINIDVYSSMSLCLFEKEILPQLSLTSFITKVVIATQEDGTISVVPDTSPTSDCLGTPLPFGFAPEGITILISNLRRLPEHEVENIVVRTDVSEPLLYIFKQEMDIATLTTPSDQQSDALLREALSLRHLDSPFILCPSALITDVNGRFRGYLLPFQPAGSLANVLSNLIGRRAVPALEPLSASHSFPPASILPPRAQLDWEIKHAWAADIVSGIAYLHQQNVFWGNVKLDNIVLCPDGRCRLIDCVPYMGVSQRYAPPEMEDLSTGLDQDTHLTPARDVFGLGLVLWALAEETGRFERAVDFVAPQLSWTPGDGFVPVWYQDLVNA